MTERFRLSEWYICNTPGDDPPSIRDSDEQLIATIHGNRAESLVRALMIVRAPQMIKTMKIALEALKIISSHGDEPSRESAKEIIPALEASLFGLDEGERRATSPKATSSNEVSPKHVNKGILPNFTVIDRELTPPNDPVFQYLLQQAANGSIPVYFTGIPLTRLRRFDDHFRPEKQPNVSIVVEAISRDWRAGRMRYMWVYPLDSEYIVADDYITFASIEKGNPDLVPCWVLGCPTGDGVEQVRGPIEVKTVKEMLLESKASVVKEFRD